MVYKAAARLQTESIGVPLQTEKCQWLGAAFTGCTVSRDTRVPPRKILGDSEQYYLSLLFND